MMTRLVRLFAIPIIIAAFAVDVVAASQRTSSELDLVLTCGARRFVKLNSDSLVAAKFAQQVSQAKFQYIASAVFSLEQTSNDQGSASDGAAFNLKLSRPFWDEAANKLIEAKSFAVKSAELLLKANLLDHLVLLNSRLLELKLVLIERGVINEQVKELQELGNFSERLMRSRVIDPADALLVKENLIRFQLRRVEVDESYDRTLTSLVTESGIRRDKFSGHDPFIGNASVAAVEADYHRARTLFKDLAGRVGQMPKTKSAAADLLAFETEYQSVRRTWYPTLAAEAGIRREVASMTVSKVPIEGFVGLGLRFQLPTQMISADLERLRALKEIENEKEKRSLFDAKNVFASKYDQLGFQFDQFKIAIKRKENLERLLALQLIKFKSGKLSFLNVNDVMLSLLESRRQSASSRMRILLAENEGRIISDVISDGSSDSIDDRTTATSGCE